jgi:transposase-like protein
MSSRPGRPPKFEPFQVMAIVELYRAGRGSLALARMFGCTHQTIINTLRRVGEEIRGAGRWYA